MPTKNDAATAEVAVLGQADMDSSQAALELTTPPFSLLVYGPSKVGKSTVMLTGPKPMLYLDIEGQTRFLPWNGRKTDYDLVSAPPVYDGTWDYVRVRINTFDQMRVAYSWLASGNHPFRSVIIDSISELQTKFVDKIAGTNQMQTQDWGELLRGLGALMRQFRDLLEHPTKPLEFIGITSMMVMKDGKQGPYLQGALKTIAPYLLDVVGYFAPYVELATGVNTQRMIFEPSPFFEAGSRVPGIQGFADNPDISQLVANVAAQRAAALAAAQAAQASG